NFQTILKIQNSVLQRHNLDMIILIKNLN
ncbi:uncharacterized protein METZ01_LOCUS456152, partial [marine metagenome]